MQYLRSGGKIKFLKQWCQNFEASFAQEEKNAVKSEVSG
jgi:hypothetical protein